MECGRRDIFRMFTRPGNCHSTPMSGNKGRIFQNLQEHLAVPGLIRYVALLNALVFLLHLLAPGYLSVLELDPRLILGDRSGGWSPGFSFPKRSARFGFFSPCSFCSTWETGWRRRWEPRV